MEYVVTDRMLIARSWSVIRRVDKMKDNSSLCSNCYDDDNAEPLCGQPIMVRICE